MQKTKRKLRIWLTAFCASLMILAMALGFAACAPKGLKIDVPERIEADLGTGTYVVPRYDVVNGAGVIMAGYSVRLKSVTDPNGEAAEISREASTIVTLSGAGEYKFVYTADSGKVADATVIMDFADRTAPTIKLSSSLFPAFYIQGVTYSVPEYTLSGDFLASKCYTKVFYNDGRGGEDEEVPMSDGSFTITNASGKYTVLIHVEDAAGNGNDYRYARSVYAPENYDPNTVVYFNEAFGERQVSPDGDYAGKFVSAADGGKAYGSEAGSYKVEFKGNETENNEAYFAINVPAIANVMAYKELEMYVYIEDGDCANGKSQWVVGSKWWNDTAVKTGEWTRISWSVAKWGNGTGANCGATTSNVISTDNIAGTRIRVIPDADYSGKTPPHGTVYFSSMRVVPYEPSQITAGENVMLDKRDGNYHIGDTVTLSAAEIGGKSLDCFLVDGKPIGGNTFVASKDAYTVTARYVDGTLTYENMTKADFAAETVTDYGGWVNFCKTGEIAENWVVEYKVVKNMAAGSSVGVYLGADHWAEIELGEEKKLHGHVGGADYWTKAADLSADVIAKLQSAGTENVTLTWIRKGNTLLVVLDGTQLVGKFDFGDYHKGAMDFGTMYRGTADKDTVGDIKYVAGEVKTNLYLGTLAVTVVTDKYVTTDKETYYLGDTVTLTAAEAPEGKAFAYFTVDGESIKGSTVVLTKFDYEIKAVYTDISTLTFGKGITSEDGKTTVGKGSTVTLIYNGVAPDGQYFKGFQVDGKPIEGNTFVATENAHSIEAVYEDKVAAGNAQLNDIQNGKNKPNDGATARFEFVTDKKYDGIDGDVKDNGSLKVTEVSGAELYIVTDVAVGTLDLTNFREVYFYVWAQSSGALGGTKWCNDTALVAGKWTKVTIYQNPNLNKNGNNPYDADGVSGKLFAEGSTGSNFIFRIMNAENNTLYVTSLYGVPCADVTVTVDEAVQEYIRVEGTLKEEHTITLKLDSTPEGKEFVCFTIDGEPYDGTTYKLGTEPVTVGAVFTDISKLTLGDGVKTADGKTQYGMGVKVSLSFDPEKLGGKVVDYYLVDKETENELRVYNGEFMTTASSHTVEAVLAMPGEMTWANGGADYGYETVMGKDSAEWKARALDGEVYGSAEYWAVSVDVKFTKDWKSFEFIQGSKQSIRVRFHEAGFCGVVLMTGKDKEGTPSSEFTVAYPTKNVQVVKKLLAGATVTCVRNGGTISTYVDGYLFFTTNYAVDHTGNWFGVGHVTANDATKPEMSNTKFITGKDKVEAYLAAYAASDKAPKSETQINGVSGVKVHSGTADLEYVAIPEGLTDANVKETKVMKATITGSEAALNVDFSFIPDLTNFEEVYFWIYTEAESVQAGTHWCANTDVTAGTWTKITVTRNTNWTYVPDEGIKYDGVPTGTHGNPYDANNSSSFVYRIMGAENKTVFVTSLYGVPKAAE